MSVITVFRKLKDKPFSMDELYAYLGMSKQSYFQKLKRQLSVNADREQILNSVLKKRKRHPKMGSRSLYYACNIDQMGINQFETYMSEQGLTVKKKKRRIITTQSGSGLKYPNLTNGLILTDTNQLIVGDITYYQAHGKTYYIFTLKDVYSKRIVGLQGSDNMLGSNALAALNQFFRLRKSKSFKGLIHHTDGGSQYKWIPYREALNKAKIQISMADNCLENGCAEQLNSVLKWDYLTFQDIKNVSQLQQQLKKVKRLINEEKPVEILGYKSPSNFEKDIENVPIEDRLKIELFDFTKIRNGFYKA